MHSRFYFQKPASTHDLFCTLAFRFFAVPLFADHVKVPGDQVSHSRSLNGWRPFEWQPVRGDDRDIDCSPADGISTPGSSRRLIAILIFFFGDLIVSI